MVGLGASTGNPTVAAPYVGGLPEGQVQPFLQQEGQGTGRGQAGDLNSYSWLRFLCLSFPHGILRFRVQKTNATLT